MTANKLVTQLTINGQLFFRKPRILAEFDLGKDSFLRSVDLLFVSILLTRRASPATLTREQTFDLSHCLETTIRALSLVCSFDTWCGYAFSMTRLLLLSPFTRSS